MRKKVVLVCEMLALSGYASAQSNVILYGVVDANIEYVNNIASTAPVVDPATGRIASPVAGSLVRMNSGGLSTNRWGLRGWENLGAGNSAVFVLEGGFALDSGQLQQGGRIFGRQIFVGLKNDNIGQLTFGRQYTSLFQTLSNFSPTAYSTQYEPIGAMTGENLRSDNTVKYTGSSGGFTTYAHWSFGNGVGSPGEVPGNAGRDTGYGAGAYYLGSTYGAAVAVDQYRPSLTALGDSGLGQVSKLAVAASYAPGPVRVMGGYRWGRSRYSFGSTLLRDNFYWIGAMYEWSKRLSLNLAYYYYDLKESRISATASANNPRNPWQVSFIADYVFSKRTDIYISTAYVRHAGLNFDTSTNGFASGYFMGQGKDSMIGVAVGMRQKF